MRKLGSCLGLLAALLATPANAYIGPGVGAGTIAVVFGVIASIILAFVAVLWYPFKRLFNAWKGSPATKSKKRDQKLNELDTDNGTLRHPDRDRGSHASRDGQLGD